MRRVSVIGVGILPFGVHSEGIVPLGARACRRAIEDAGLGPERMEAFFLGNFAGHAFTGRDYLAPLIAHSAGLGPVPCTRLEGACASGGLAMRQGVLTVASGDADVVLVSGVEKMTSVPTSEAVHILESADEHKAEMWTGATFPALFALIAQRHMYEFGTTRADLAAVAVKNHAHGLLNPNAHLRKEISTEDVFDAHPVAEPLGLYDFSPISDGAAAIVLCASDMAADLHPNPVAVMASTQASDISSLAEKRDITRFGATVRAAERAFQVAGLQPEDIDLAEIHDCFTVAEIIALEDIGFYRKGEGARGARDGDTRLGGTMPVNPSGGLKSLGHPLGAIGVAQVGEVVLQLRGEAGSRQVPGAEVGLAHNLGGVGATCTVHIFSSRV